MDEEEQIFGEDTDLNNDLMEPLDDDMDFAGLDDDNEDDQFDKDH